MVCEMSESGANLSDFGLVMRLLMSDYGGKLGSTERQGLPSSSHLSAS